MARCLRGSIVTALLSVTGKGSCQETWRGFGFAVVLVWQVERKEYLRHARALDTNSMERVRTRTACGRHALRIGACAHVPGPLRISLMESCSAGSTTAAAHWIAKSKWAVHNTME